MINELVSNSQSLTKSFLHLIYVLGFIVAIEQIFFKRKRFYKPVLYFLIFSFVILLTLDLINQYNFKKEFNDYSQYNNLKIKYFDVEIYKKDSELFKNKIVYSCKNVNNPISECILAIKENLKKDLENGIIK